MLCQVNVRRYYRSLGARVLVSSAVNDVSDRFDVKETLGVGAMGVVERAYDRIRRIDVAVKNLRRLDGRTLYHFKREFRSQCSQTCLQLIRRLVGSNR